MPAELSQGAFAGYPSDGSGNRSPSEAGSDVIRTQCAGSGYMPDAQRTWSGPVVEA